MERVPAEIYRRVAQLLEDMRFSEMAPAWERAALSQSARPLYRPDVEGIAYYEFAVTIGGVEPAGFIIASAGRHDHPIAHWNYQGLSVTQTLDRKAAATNTLAARYYKLDALAYAAEDRSGAQIASTDAQLQRVSGQTRAMMDQPAELTHATWQPDQNNQQGRLNVEGPSGAVAYTLSAWNSWAELKAGYASSYATLTESLARQASQDWQIEQQATQYGEGVRVGERRTLALLGDRPDVRVSGDGERHVEVNLRARDGLRSVLDLAVRDTSDAAETPFTITIDYLDGRIETLNFTILNRVESQSTTQQGANVTAAGEWSPWHYYWADGSQRWYNQMDAYSAPNTSDCYSGCGATAWAMLFGWADNLAAQGHYRWAGHGGIYRQNGGYGWDAVAPQWMDDGVRNMTWELRQRIGTFCSFGSGATYPSTMAYAGGYLYGRDGAWVDTHYNAVGYHEDRLRDYAINSIVYRRTPAIIGTGWLNHYPLAYGYAWQSRTVREWWWETTEYNRWFYVNQGWGGDSGWVSASTWFAGELYP